MTNKNDYQWELSLIELLDLLQQPSNDYDITPLTTHEATKAIEWIEAVVTDGDPDIIAELDQDEYEDIANILTYHLIHGDYQTHITDQQCAFTIAQAANTIGISEYLTRLANQPND